LPRKTDSHNPADWLYLAEPDLEEPDWADLRRKIEAVGRLLAAVQVRLRPGPAAG